MPTQYAQTPSHAPTPSFDTVMAVALSESASEVDQVMKTFLLPACRAVKAVTGEYHKLYCRA